MALFITSLSKEAISTPISCPFLSLLLLISNNEVMEDIVSTAFLHEINSDCSHTHRSTGHYIRIHTCVYAVDYLLHRVCCMKYLPRPLYTTASQTSYPKQLLRGWQRPSVVVRDVPRIACPKIRCPPDICSRAQVFR